MTRQVGVTSRPKHFDTEIEAIKRPVMRVGAAGAAVTALILVLTGILTDNSDLMIGALGPAVVAGLFAWQAITTAQQIPLAMSLAVLMMVVMHGIVGQERLQIAVALAAVLISSVGILFTGDRVTAYFAFQALVLVAGAVVWGDSAADRAALAGTMFAGFSVIAYIMNSMRQSSVRAAKQYSDLFENSPVALLEEDWSATRRATAELGISDPEELQRHLAERPELVAELVSLVRITKVNTAAVKLAQLESAAELLGPIGTGRVNQTSLAGMIDQIVAVFLRRGSFESNYETTSYRGEPMWVSVRWVQPAQARSNPDAVVVAVHDVTLEVRARHNLEKSMRSKDEFIASVSHELRTPLTAVVGLAGELAQNADQIGAAESTELLELIAGQSREMAFIVEDLLVAARADMDEIVITPERVPVAANLSRIVSEFDWASSIELPESNCEVLADPVRFRQIVRNLIANAHRYGGSRRRIVCDNHGPQVRIEIRDNGPGLPEAERERIFEPYARAHSRPGVTASVGLGLAVSRRLARLMDGELTYDYDPEENESVFRLTLPCAPAGDAGAHSG